jgi:hypothetical protein
MYGHMVTSNPEVARAQIEERRREAERYELGRLARRLFKRTRRDGHEPAIDNARPRGGVAASPALGAS